MNFLRLLRSMGVIAMKELKGYFVSPIGYFVLSVFTIISGIYFYIMTNNFFTRFNQYQMYAQMYQNPEIMQRVNLNEMVIAPVFQFLIIVMIFIVPALSMRMISEEKRMKTDELLLTSPINIYGIVLGKFLGAFLFMTIMLATSLLYIGTLFHYGNPEMGPVISGYLGLLGIGAVLLAIGLFASSLTHNQINSYFMAFAIGLLLLITGWAGQLSSSHIGQVLSYLSITEHYKQFAQGVIDSKDVVYYGTFMIFFLFLTKQSLESVRWR